MVQLLPVKIRTLALVLVIAWLAAGLTLQLRPSAVCIVGAGTDLACARGFETREHDGRRPFRWSNGYAEVHLPGAGLAAPGVATIVLRSGRPAGALPVPVQLGLNGRQLVAFAAPPEERRLRLLLPSAGLGGRSCPVTVCQRDLAARCA
ncbi:MAG: hypothetical protein KatS3mg057_0160 [Herpetosiphonaceae bacterium]|nr:MAG: hypothetical protein KatS3mg057_0160 [Herpetosiphonaceae bacterium]